MYRNTATSNRIIVLVLVALVAGAAIAETKQSSASGMQGRIAKPRPVTGTVNINTASTNELALLPRVGPAVAQRIVEYRDKNGGFKRIEDLLNVRGIGEKSLEALRPHLSLTGATTIKTASSSV